MEREVANPFKMLSAYLIVAATTSPPTAWRTMTVTTELVQPTNSPKIKEQVCNKSSVNHRAQEIPFKSYQSQGCIYSHIRVRGVYFLILESGVYIFLYQRDWCIFSHIRVRGVYFLILESGVYIFMKNHFSATTPF